ncbi:MAG TPA: kynureninase, partial [Saprospiraceae bacterium]|nr:kynureninase [Saprospiraceae bacterium]
DAEGNEQIYLCGNSLGLQPKTTKEYIDNELEDWKNLGVEGHVHARHPWMPYHEFLTEKMARIVGALPSEVVVMNSLTVNLHLMMVSFYRPTKERYKILIEYSPFPSDIYAVKSQLEYHGYDAESALIHLKPEEGTDIVSLESYRRILEEEGERIALVMIGGVNYYTGQLYPLAEMTRLAHATGAMIGFDLAHGAGNVRLSLHDVGCDFAVWCSYKYLNSGPGSLAGCFVHERHKDFDGPRLAGWWGHEKESRFRMGPDYIPIPGAEGWQLSNPPILSMAAIMASLDIFDEAGMDRLVEKSRNLTAYTEYLIKAIDSDAIELITPTEPGQRGCQLSIRVKGADKTLFGKISEAGVIADWREPDVVRIAPVPLYNSYLDVFRFVQILRASL